MTLFPQELRLEKPVGMSGSQKHVDIWGCPGSVSTEKKKSHYGILENTNIWIGDAGEFLE